MLPSWCSQSITRVRPGTKTVRGADAPDWDSTKVSELTITGCSIQLASTSLSLDGRVLGISDGLTVYCPEGSDVRAGDHIVANGQIYEIQGEPRAWTGAFTRSHVQLNLIRWEG